MPQQALIDLIAQNLTQKSSSDRITGVELREVMYTLVNDLYGEFLTGTDVNTELNLRFKNRGLFSSFTFGLVSVNDVFYNANGIAYYCVQTVAYSPVGSNPPLTDTDYYRPLTNVDISRKITFIDWESDLSENYSVIKGQIVRMNGTGGDATSEYWYIALQDYTGTKTAVNPLISRTYYFDITGHTHAWSGITDKPTTFSPSAHASTHTNGTDDIQLATASQKGLMSSTYASKLDGIAAGAEVNVNADWNAVSGDAQIFNKPNSFTPSSHASTHTNGTDDIQLATASQKGLMSSTYASKLDGLVFGTTVDWTQNKVVPIDADKLLIWDSVTNTWKSVLKSDLNEIYVGTGNPTHNEVLMIDNTADLLVYKSATTATITPNNTLKVDKYNSNYASGNTVSVDSPTFDTGKYIDYDDERVVVIKNIKAGTVTFVINTLSTIVGGVTYNYIILNGETFDLGQGKYAEISYLYTMTSSTTCDVLIRIAK